VQNYTIEWVKFADPRLPLQRSHRVGIASFPSLGNAVWRKIDVLGMTFPFQAWR
jgi:hypothetical protein